MNTTPDKPSEELFDSEFSIKFKALKKLRNSHHIDEPEFDEQVEQLAADIYAHSTRDGWCCACDADIAFAMDDIQKEPEFQSAIDTAVEQLSGYLTEIVTCENGLTCSKHQTHDTETFLVSYQSGRLTPPPVEHKAEEGE